MSLLLEIVRVGSPYSVYCRLEAEIVGLGALAGGTTTKREWIGKLETKFSHESIINYSYVVA